MKHRWLLMSLCTALPAGAQTPPSLQHGQIGTAAELTAQRGPTTPEVIGMRRDQVPPDLVDLIPLAEKWGIADDELRDEMQQRATAAEKKALGDALKGRHARITAWLDTFPQGQPMPDAAAAFMYLQLGSDEMGLMP
ncbi:hypothetical protein [Stenotrophomonas sp. YAU14A_MKIMI4_1]|uniref:hypothetical protein n=1 Tax=Stenotrophomonas sp. YAU14A_MKIMI4_1 TaxID=2072408 RepID=UPI000D540EA1|nr:hypothetical protein [Stenotrophomonas sp. YAU14A_MKIMI4_1]AWH30661.1 hypothetical protein C1931_17915 [Stenotrophomonas sp. YAU14A_MKIMI4_1]